MHSQHLIRCFFNVLFKVRSLLRFRPFCSIIWSSLPTSFQLLSLLSSEVLSPPSSEVLTYVYLHRHFPYLFQVPSLSFSQVLCLYYCEPLFLFGFSHYIAHWTVLLTSYNQGLLSAFHSYWYTNTPICLPPLYTLFSQLLVHSSYHNL